jgi:RecB family exonuclease
MLDLDRIEDQIQSPRIIWSTSALKSIGTCGKQYYLRYRDPESVSELTPPLAFGSSIHKLIELLHTEKIWEERVWQRRWDDVWYDYSSQVNWGNYRKISFDKLGPQMIGSYIDKNRDAKVIESEIKFEFEIDGFPVRGVIDQIRQLPGNTLQIVDFKTSKDPMDPLLLRADPQWTFYYLYAREMYPKKKI